MNTFGPLCLLPVALLAFQSVQAADLTALEQELDLNPLESCQEAIEYYQEGELGSAAESADICASEMKEMQQHQAASSFPDEVDGFVGGEIDRQNVMGFNQIERIYTKEGVGRITVTLSGGQMAGMMQMAINVSGRKTKLGKHSGHILSQNGDNSIYVPMGEAALNMQSQDVAVKIMKRFGKRFLKVFSR